MSTNLPRVEYIDIPRVAKKGMNWNVFVGARRTGKTYGILKRFILERTIFIFARRTDAELEECLDKDPFGELNEDLHKEYCVTYKRNTGGIIYSDYKKTNQIGIAVAMSAVRKMRGANFNKFSELFYDEFIPEEGALRRASDGYTCVNAFETIFSNRELPPHCKPPMKVWLAANPIDLFDPTLEALNLTEEVSRLGVNHQKSMSDPGRSLYLYHGGEKSVADAKKETSLYRFIGADSDVARHILMGEFRGGDIASLAKKVDFKHYRCVFDIDNIVFVYVHKTDMDWYVSTAKQECKQHFTRKCPYALRQAYGMRYRMLRTMNFIKFDNVAQIELLDAIFM